ncbi:calcineurin B-like protein 4 [Tanacetum coccineum]
MDLQEEDESRWHIAKHKARLVIKEFRQREGLDYIDTYSFVTRITSTRMVLAIAALRNLEVHLMDVKPTFLNGDLEEEIYMNQPQGFIAPELKSKVCRLVKSLYDLRKAPKQGHQISPYHKMFFYLITLNLAWFLNETAPQVEPPKEGKLSNAQAVQAVEAWKHSDFLCHNYVLNGLVDSLYNMYCKTTTAKEL